MLPLFVVSNTQLRRHLVCIVLFFFEQLLFPFPLFNLLSEDELRRRPEDHLNLPRRQWWHTLAGVDFLQSF